MSDSIPGAFPYLSAKPYTEVHSPRFGSAIVDQHGQVYMPVEGITPAAFTGDARQLTYTGHIDAFEKALAKDYLYLRNTLEEIERRYGQVLVTKRNAPAIVEECRNLATMALRGALTPRQVKWRDAAVNRELDGDNTGVDAP